MKIKKIGCLRSFLVGLSALVMLCLILVGLVTWDNAHLPERSKITDKLTQQEKVKNVQLHLASN